ncbi:hypothetical protein [Methylobacter tundripaludum]|uniref:hypothetical protein n=1 Tax=Methylobacter tundripaludum TaxID=173365 RepID=UPI00068F551F|nr:hypothetical protein [Methylobacter tundripaludum]
MLFTDEFVDSLKDDPIKGSLEIFKVAAELQNKTIWNELDHEKLIEVCALLTELIESELLIADLEYFELTGNIHQDCTTMRDFMNRLHLLCREQATSIAFQSKRSKFKATLGTSFCYEFSQGDMNRVQLLVNQIRDLISSSENLEADHQRRLLMRLEKLQSELHKRMPDLDRFWGLIGDAGVVLGKLGTDAKPVVDRVKEIADIVWQTQSRAEELPSGTNPPLLENNS